MTKPPKRWLKSRIQGLVKCGRTGKYFGRAKISGAYKYESLQTFDYEVACSRLEKFLDRIRKKRKAIKKRSARILLEDLFKEFRKRTEEDSNLKPASIKARMASLDRIEKTWPNLMKMDPSTLDFDMVKKWVARLKSEGTEYTPPGAKKSRKGNSSSAVNKSIGALGMVLDLAAKKGLVFENVARLDGLRIPESFKDVHIPSKSEFERILEELKKQNGRAAYCAEFLACSGCRIEEATSLTFRMVSFEKREISIPGTKTESSLRKIPMTEQLFKLVDSFYREVEDVAKELTPDQRVFPLDSINLQLGRACEKAGVSRITNHSLRHYFGTTCLEAGIPAHTVAAWLGHKDGGALLLKIYAHLRDHHSREVIRDVKF